VKPTAQGIPATKTSITTPQAMTIGVTTAPIGSSIVSIHPLGIVTTQVAKRGRGRPRKHVVSSLTDKRGGILCLDKHEKMIWDTKHVYPVQQSCRCMVRVYEVIVLSVFTGDYEQYLRQELASGGLMSHLDGLKQRIQMDGSVRKENCTGKCETARGYLRNLGNILLHAKRYSNPANATHQISSKIISTLEELNVRFR
jgi:hypothetical protein